MEKRQNIAILLASLFTHSVFEGLFSLFTHSVFEGLFYFFTHSVFEGLFSLFTHSVFEGLFSLTTHSVFEGLFLALLSFRFIFNVVFLTINYSCFLHIRDNQVFFLITDNVIINLPINTLPIPQLNLHLMFYQEVL